MIKIAIYEDEQVLLEQLTGYVKTLLNKHSIIYNIESYTNGNAVLIRKPFDILLLDIAMEPLNGMELAKKLRARGDDSKIIFITSYQQYAIEAYDVQAFHYLVKPVDIEKLEEILLKIYNLIGKEDKQAMVIHQGAIVKKVSFEKILYLEVMNRKIYLHKNRETIPFYGKLSELEPTLPKEFFRCHRSYIVNFAHVLQQKLHLLKRDFGEQEAIYLISMIVFICAAVDMTGTRFAGIRSGNAEDVIIVAVLCSLIALGGDASHFA